MGDFPKSGHIFEAPKVSDMQVHFGSIVLQIIFSLNLKALRGVPAFQLISLDFMNRFTESTH